MEPKTGHHEQHGSPEPSCPQCLVKPNMARSAMFAWTVTAIAVAVLIIVLLLGAQSRGGLWAAGGGLFLLMILACPLMMGGMMWMMMRMDHQH